LSACPYSAISPEDAWIITEFVVAAPHDNPLTPCHTVVAPRRHVAAFYDLDVQEQRMMWDVIGEIRKRVTSSLKVEGFDSDFADASSDDKDLAHENIQVVGTLNARRARQFGSRNREGLPGLRLGLGNLFEAGSSVSPSKAASLRFSTKVTPIRRNGVLDKLQISYSWAISYMRRNCLNASMLLQYLLVMGGLETPAPLPVPDL
jgi:hypothetical protein